MREIKTNASPGLSNKLFEIVYLGERVGMSIKLQTSLHVTSWNFIINQH